MYRALWFAGAAGSVENKRRCVFFPVIERSWSVLPYRSAHQLAERVKSYSVACRIISVLPLCSLCLSGKVFFFAPGNNNSVFEMSQEFVSVLQQRIAQI